MYQELPNRRETAINWINKQYANGVSATEENEHKN